MLYLLMFILPTFCFAADTVIRKDNQKEERVVTKIPSLDYQYGTITLNLNDISLIRIVSKQEMEVITSSGDLFLGRPSSDPVMLESGEKMEALLPEELHLISLDLRPSTLEPSPFQINLREGHKLSGNIEGGRLKLRHKNGLLTSIEPKQLIEFQLEDDTLMRLSEHGKVVQLTGCYPIREHLDFSVTATGQTFHIPWRDVERITQRSYRKDYLNQNHEETLAAVGCVSCVSDPHETAIDDRIGLIEPEEKIILVERSQYVEFEEDEEDTRDPEEEMEEEKKETFEILSAIDDFEMDDLPVDDEDVEMSQEFEFLSAIDDFELENLPVDDEDVEMSEEFEFLTMSEETEEDDLALQDDEIEHGEPPIDVPVGEDFEFEDKDEEIEEIDQPHVYRFEVRSHTPGMRYLSSREKPGKNFYLAPKKVSNRDYLAFVKAIGYKPPIHWSGGKIPTGTDDQPVTNVSYVDAYLYTVWKGVRLPTQEELALACELPGCLEDINGSYLEWTSTPSDVSSINCKECMDRGHIAVQLSDNETSQPLRNETSSRSIGFRCALSE